MILFQTTCYVRRRVESFGDKATYHQKSGRRFLILRMGHRAGSWRIFAEFDAEERERPPQIIRGRSSKVYCNTQHAEQAKICTLGGCDQECRSSRSSVVSYVMIEFNYRDSYSTSNATLDAIYSLPQMLEYEANHPFPVDHMCWQILFALALLIETLFQFFT